MDSSFRWDDRTSELIFYGLVAIDATRYAVGRGDCALTAGAKTPSRAPLTIHFGGQANLFASGGVRQKPL